MIGMVVLVLFALFCFFIFLPICFLKELIKRSPYDHRQKEKLLRKKKCLACARTEWWTGEKCNRHK